MILSSEIKNATETQRQTNKLYIAESFHKMELSSSLLPDISSILVLLICLNSEHYTSFSHIVGYCINELFLMRLLICLLWILKGILFN